MCALSNKKCLVAQFNTIVVKQKSYQVVTGRQDPELNPGENIWNMMNSHILKEKSRNIQELKLKLSEYLNLYKSNNYWNTFYKSI